MKKIFIFLFSVAILGNYVIAAPTKQVTIRNFSGLNSRIDSEDLPYDEVTRAENLRFEKQGAVQKRANRAKYNTTSLGTDPINWLARYYYGDNKQLLIGYDTTIRLGDDENSTFSTAKSGLTADLHFDDETYKDILYLANGTDTNLRYDGTNFENWGLATPATVSLATNASSGLASGTYGYKYTYMYDGYQESNPSDAASILVTAPNQVVLSSVATGNTAVTARKIYRTEADGSIYYYLTTLSDNSTTTYTDSTVDSGLDTTSQPPTDHYSPSVFKYIVLHQERLFGAGNSNYPSRLYFSSIESGLSLPDSFPATNYFDISPDDGDKITGIDVDNTGTLCIFKRNSIRKIFTNGKPAQWRISDPFSTAGCIAPYTLRKIPQGIIYLTRRGDGRKEVRVFNGQVSSSISENIEPTLDDISDIYIDNVVGFYHDEKYYLSYTDKTTGATYNNKVLVYDVVSQKWSKDTNKYISSFCAWNGGNDAGELYTGEANTGFVYRENADLSSSDLYIRTKTDLDNGATFAQVTVAGTEENPLLYLDATAAGTLVGAAVSSAAATACSVLTGDYDTAYPNGVWDSAVTYVGATNLYRLVWNENMPNNSEVWTYIRTGASVAACQSASWNGPYSTPSGSDISAVTAADYVQVRVRMFLEDLSLATSNYLYRDDFVLRVYAGLGAPAESAIYFIWQTGGMDFGSPYARKRFRQIRVRHEANAQSYTIYYKVDDNMEQSFTVDTSTDEKSYKANFPISQAFGERLRLRIEDSSGDDFTLKEILILYSDEAINW